MEYFVRDGVSLAYETFGDPTDRPVVLLHGLGADGEMWSPQVERYPSEGYFLVVPDLRGHGESDAVEEFSVEDCADDVAGLLDELALEAAAVVGVSMGGLVAQRFAIANPDRVSSLVLADTFSGIRGPVARLNARLAEVGLRLLPRRWQLRLVEWYYDAPEHEALRAYFRAMLLRTDPEQLRQARRAVNRFDCTGELDRITAPTRVLAGEGNGGWFLDLARTTADGIADAEFEVVPGGTDPSNLSATAAFDERVLGFLGATAEARARPG